MKYILLTSLFLITACNSQSQPSAKEFTSSMERGKALYTDFCITCHLPNGKGLPKTFPPLAGSDYLKNNRALSIKSIKYGQQGEILVNGITYNNVMASMGLTDEEVADVMNYITNSWGNKNGNMITPEEVSKIQQ